MSRASAVVLGLASTLVVCASWLSLAGPEAEDLLVNRAWAERMPKDRKDMVTWFVPLEVRGKRFGLAEQMSHYAFAGERFVYTRDGDRLALSFQQSGRKLTVNAKARDCRGQAPQGFELCLDLTAGGERVTFYSRRDWRVPSKGADLPPFDTRPLADEERALPEASDGLGLLLQRP